MNQIQRDETYRLNAVESICEQYGRESEICRQAIQTWETQHSTNIVRPQAFLYIKLTGSVFVILILALTSYSWFLKLKQKN